MFLGVALYAGCVAVVREWKRPPGFDLVAVLRKDKSAVAGFYVGKTSSDVYALLAVLPSDATTKRASASPALDPKAQSCKDEGKDGQDALKDRSDCYPNELVSVSNDQVSKLVLAASRRRDEQHAPKQQEKKKPRESNEDHSDPD